MLLAVKKMAVKSVIRGLSYKTFYGRNLLIFVTRVFVPGKGKPFQPSLVFAGKVGAYPSGASPVLHSRVGSWPHPPTLDLAGKA